MATILLGATVVLACSALAGQGICVLGGSDRWVWWAPGVGFAALVAVAGALIRAPGHDKTAAGAVALVTASALASARVRHAVRGALPEALPVAAFTLFAAALPFLVTGRAGMLGVGVNDDLSAHAATAWWLVHETGPVPVGATGSGALAHVGYPIGPHGLAAALSLGHLSLVRAFDAVIVVVPALIAVVALGVTRGEPPRVLRWLAAVLVGLCYLVAAFTAQASFKETMEALFLVTTALVARDTFGDAEAPGGWRAGIPIGVACAGSVWVYSYVGLPWTVGAAAAIALTGALRRALTALPGVLLAGAVLVAPAIPAISKFASSPFVHDHGSGNLVHELNPLEGLGVWLGSDFRWTPNPLGPTIALAAAAGLAALIALFRLIRAHRLALPAALIPALAIVAWTFAEKGAYVSAKTLVIVAPLVMLTTAAGLMLPAARRPRPALHLTVALLALVTAGAAGLSSFLALRDGAVGPTAHAAELAHFRPLIGRSPVLVMIKDDIAEWEFVGLPEYKPGPLYAPLFVNPRPSKPTLPGGFYDWDNFLPATLDRFRYAVTARTAFQSLAPANWQPIANTRSYVLWRRRGRTPDRIGADFAGRPGRVLRCDTGYGRARIAWAGPHGGAVVLPRPIVGRGLLWRGQTRHAGDSATMTLRVPAGAWDLSIEYASITGLQLRAENLSAALPASMDRIGPFWLAGTVYRTHAGPLTIHVTANRMNGFARFLGAPGVTRGLDSPSNRPLADVALTRHAEQPRRVRPSAACGRFVDYFERPG